LERKQATRLRVSIATVRWQVLTVFGPGTAKAFAKTYRDNRIGSGQSRNRFFSFREEGNGSERAKSKGTTRLPISAFLLYGCTSRPIQSPCVHTASAVSEKGFADMMQKNMAATKYITTSPHND